MKFKIILIVAVILVSCSPQKRLNRLIERNPELMTVDTLRDTVTVIVPEVKIDTFLTLTNLLDTVYITEDRLKIKTIYKDNKIYIEGKCDTDTVEVIREIPVERIIVQELTWWERNQIWVIPLIIVSLVFAIRKKFF